MHLRITATDSIPGTMYFLPQSKATWMQTLTQHACMFPIYIKPHIHSLYEALRFTFTCRAMLMINTQYIILLGDREMSCHIRMRLPGRKRFWWHLLWWTTSHSRFLSDRNVRAPLEQQCGHTFSTIHYFIFHTNVIYMIYIKLVYDIFVVWSCV